MSPIDPIGSGTAFRASSAQSLAPAARSGADKAAAMQSAGNAAPAAPVETARAVLQTETAQRTAMNTAPPPKEPGAEARVPVPPMTAVLLHELRLQQELAAVQARKEEAPGK